MYRFNFNGTACECETAEELRAAIGSNGNVAKARRPYQRRKARKPASRVREGVVASWDKAKRVAKRLGRNDVANVRSELKAGTVTE